MDTQSLLVNAGLRVTRPREAVLAALLGSARALSHAEIARQSGVEGVDRVTVYRSLAALEAAGLVHSVTGADGVSRFQVHDRSAPGCPGGHPHFHCSVCGGLWCLEDQGLPRVEVPAGARVDGKQLVVHGRCAACVAAEGGQP